MKRRQFLCAGAPAVVGLSECSSRLSLRWSGLKRLDVRAAEIHGANYLPARAFNAYQMWRGYSPAVIERDLEYASRLGLNAVRVFLSFEFWREDSPAHFEAFEHLLETAARKGIRVLAVLFDTVGVAPTDTNLTDRDPLTASGVFSPSAAIVDDRGRWNLPKTFVRQFMRYHRDDPRLLAIDVMNEPDVHGLPEGAARMALTRALLETMVDRRGAVPLTVGTMTLEYVHQFVDLGIDVIQCHQNFPGSTGAMRELLGYATRVKRTTDLPVWLSEWQRIRPDGSGWQGDPLGAGEWGPNYSSLAAPVRASSIDGDFFWSLMLKPAHLRVQRRSGSLNGVFHEDGAVWSLDDARALAGASFRAPERRAWPAWAAAVPKRYGVSSASGNGA